MNLCFYNTIMGGLWLGEYLVFSYYFFNVLYSAMYKTRNTGTGNRMRRPRGMGGMSLNIPGNVLKPSGRQTFWGMLPNILGNVLKHCGECLQTFWEMAADIPGNVPLKHSGNICDNQGNKNAGLVQDFILLFFCLV